LPFIFLFLAHIAARGAMVALAFSLLFWAGATLWVRSRKFASAVLGTVIVIAVVASGLFYEYALRDKDVDKVAPEAVSRTIRAHPQFRLQIWTRAIDRFASEPGRLPFGRGVGVFPIDEGYGPPNWLLRPTEGSKHYPHDVYLELLYEAGLAGFLVFATLALLPLFFSLRHWNRSGSFAYSYDIQFFFSLAAGVVALKRRKLSETGGLAMRPDASPLPEIQKTPA